MEFPCSFLLFSSNEEYVEACTFCSGFHHDVLELLINGLDVLVFFSVSDFNACRFFCEINGFVVRMYRICFEQYIYSLD